MFGIKKEKLPVKVGYDEPESTIVEGTDLREGFKSLSMRTTTDGLESDDYDSSNGIGWKIKPKQTSTSEGAEFSDVKIGTRQITVISGQDVQASIDKANNSGGGRVYLKNGTHLLTSNLTLYSNVYLQGENAGSAILDFQNNAYGIQVIGSNSYTTGTIAVTNNSTTVTGVSTVWISAMVGRKIMLGGAWWTIAAVASNTSLTIAAPFAGVTLAAGTSYTIATLKEDVKITDLTIKTASSGIKAQYTNELFIKDIDIQSSVTGIEIIDSAQADIAENDMTANNNGVSLTNCHFMNLNSLGSIDTLAGNGMTMDNCSSIAGRGLFMINSSGDGINITDCNNMNFSGITCTENGGSGLEFVSGNSDIPVFGSAFENNGDDGIKLTGTTDNLQIIGNTIKDNTGYGVNIATSDCDGNNITGNNFSGNTTAEINDSGTDTIIQGNYPEDINSPRTVKKFTTGEAISANDAVYNKVSAGLNTHSVDLVSAASQYLSITDASQTGLDITGNISMEMSVRLETAPATNNNYYLISKRITGGSENSWTFAYENASGTNRLALNLFDAAAPSTNVPYRWTQSLTVGTWYHIAVVWTQSTGVAELYIDSVSQGTITDTSAADINNSTAPFEIGAMSSSGYFDGLIDEVRIYNDVRTATEIANNYQTQMNALDEPNLQGYWKLNNDLLDETTNNNDLTNNGSASFSTTTPFAGTTGSFIYKASALNANTSNTFLGFAVKAIAKDVTGNVIVGGVVPSLSGLNSGSQYYLADTSGTISTTVGTNTRKIGIAISTTELLITNIW